MKRVWILLFLTLGSSATWADWIEVARTDRAIMYVDLATIRRAGNITKMWYLLDFKNPQNSGSGKPSYMSSRDQSEYDCEGERHRTLYYTNHTSSMGAGETVFSSDGIPLNWFPIAPGTLGAAAWAAACGKN